MCLHMHICIASYINILLTLTEEKLQSEQDTNSISRGKKDLLQNIGNCFFMSYCTLRKANRYLCKNREAKVPTSIARSQCFPES